MLRRSECRLNFKNRPVRTGDLKGGPKQPPLPLIGVARSLPLIGLMHEKYFRTTNAVDTLPLRWGLQISWPFLYIHWECCTKFFSFYFAQRRLQDHFLGGMFAKFRHFFKFSETVKIWLRVMDLLIEKLVLKFGLNRSRNNEVITFLNIWWKNGDCYFWPPNPKFADFGIFENGSCSSRREKSNGI